MPLNPENPITSSPESHKPKSTEVASDLASQLGYLGLLPFLGSVLATLVGVDISMTLQAFLVYGAVILSFLGGIHWGWMMNKSLPEPQIRLKLAMAPSLLGWIALLLPPLAGIALLALGFIGWWAYESRLPAERWYRDLRKRLSFVVLGCHLIWFLMLWRATNLGDL
ncbi:DUF3429 domain-containing protein [Pokkaliibacter sp. CJK22405]|uniref:DUF3429 domain-containing protein n=1 Tax=Pokkaliibacter sp. CJK22405 TaxID=3384615 RepID=UPI0039847539